MRYTPAPQSAQPDLTDFWACLAGQAKKSRSGSVSMPATPESATTHLSLLTFIKSL
jgi:hypothetical protein